jgi:predicted transglutaminase-like cysteine proteinase
VSSGWAWAAQSPASLAGWHSAGWEPRADAELAIEPASFRIEPQTIVPVPATRVSDLGTSAATPAAAEPAPLRDDRPDEALLSRVNTHVNGHVHQQSDLATYGVAELWRPSGDGPHAVGDCEDLAIEKRIELLAAHFPPQRLFFAVVYARDIGLHTVLVARLDSGDVVLDSRSPFIEPWSRTPYSWLAIETPGAPQVWHQSA